MWTHNCGGWAQRYRHIPHLSLPLPPAEYRCCNVVTCVAPENTPKKAFLEMSIIPPKNTNSYHFVIYKFYYPLSKQTNTPQKLHSRKKNTTEFLMRWTENWTKSIISDSRMAPHSGQNCSRQFHYLKVQKTLVTSCNSGYPTTSSLHWFPFQRTTFLSPMYFRAQSELSNPEITFTMSTGVSLTPLPSQKNPNRTTQERSKLFESVQEETGKCQIRLKTQPSRKLLRFPSS